MFAVFGADADDWVLGECRFDAFEVGFAEVDFVGDDHHGDFAGLEVAEDRDVDLRIRVLRGIQNDQHCVHLVEPFDAVDDAFGGFFGAFFRFGRVHAELQEVLIIDPGRDAGRVDEVEEEFVAVFGFDGDLFFDLDFAGFVRDVADAAEFLAEPVEADPIRQGRFAGVGRTI